MLKKVSLPGLRHFLLVPVVLFLTFGLVAGCSWNGNGNGETGDAPGANGDRTVLEYGHVPSISATEKYDELLPLKNYLESELPVKINLNFASDYSTVIEKIKDGQYDFVTMGPLSYVEASAAGVVEPAVKPVRYGDTSYRSLIITHSNSGVESIRDFKNRDFAFVDRKSASGFLFPYAYLKKNGVDPEENLTYAFRGGHVEVAAGVWLENFSGGAIYDDARQDMDNTSRVLESTRVVAKTHPIPNEPWIFRREFANQNRELVDRVTELLLELSARGTREKKILDNLGIDGFAPASDQDYEVVREYSDYLPEVEE